MCLLSGICGYNHHIENKYKGDGNDGEPDARQKLEFEKKGQKLVGINILWMVWDDI